VQNDDFISIFLVKILWGGSEGRSYSSAHRNPLNLIITNKSKHSFYIIPSVQWDYNLPHTSQNASN